MCSNINYRQKAQMLQGKKDEKSFTKKRFRRYKVTPIKILNPLPGYDLPRYIAIEIAPAQSENFLYTLIPVSTWQNEADLMDFVNAVVAEAGV